MQIDLSDAERTLVLMALWNDHLMQQQVNQPLIGTEHEFDAMVIFQEKFDLVRKLGGDPERPLFGVAG